MPAKPKKKPAVKKKTAPKEETAQYVRRLESLVEASKILNTTLDELSEEWGVEL